MREHPAPSAYHKTPRPGGHPISHAGPSRALPARPDESLGGHQSYYVYEHDMPPAPPLTSPPQGYFLAAPSFSLGQLNDEPSTRLGPFLTQGSFSSENSDGAFLDQTQWISNGHTPGVSSSFPTSSDRSLFVGDLTEPSPHLLGPDDTWNQVWAEYPHAGSPVLAQTSNHVGHGTEQAFLPSLPVNGSVNNVDWIDDCFHESLFFWNPTWAASRPGPSSLHQGTGQHIAPRPAPVTGPLTMHEQPSKRKRRKPDAERLERTKRLRKMGACFRCKIYKLPCSEGLICEECYKVQATQKVYRGPCVRLSIEIVHTFREGDADNGTLRAELRNYQWRPEVQVKSVTVQWPFSDSSRKAPLLVIDYQPFVPDSEVLVEEYVVNGIVRRVKLPPMACRDTKKARRDIGKFLTNSQDLLEHEILDSLDDPILKVTWTEVMRYRSKHGSSLLTCALKVAAGAMMNSKYPTSVEPNVFGVEDQEHTPHFFQKLPLPTQLTFQIQTMIAQEMSDTQKQCLKELRARVFSKDRIKHWYEVFLTIFVLLATVEWVYRVQIAYQKAKKGVSESIETNISYVTKMMLDEWERSALHLVDHFRCVMNGDIPFSQSWDEGSENQRRAGLESEAVAFIRTIKGEVEKRRDELRETSKLKGRSRFEKPLAAICALFLQDDEIKKEKQ